MTANRKPGNFDNYEGPLEDGGFRCKTCGGDIKAVRQTHSVWFRGFVGGPGRVTTTMEPYCPTCEERPPESGPPVYDDE